MEIYNYILLIVLILLFGFLILSSKQKLIKKSWLKRTVNIVAIIAIVFITFVLVLFPNLRSIKITGEYSYASTVLELTNMSCTEELKSDGSPRNGMI
jgi:glucan phosphoethanolaminetransferase (alkaline phosphatase superfamily)